MRKLFFLVLASVYVVIAHSEPSQRFDAGSNLRSGMLVTIILDAGVIVDTYRGQSDDHYFFGASCMERYHGYLQKNAVRFIVPILAPNGKMQTMTCEVETISLPSRT